MSESLEKHMSILRLSNEEAIRDLEAICQSIMLLKAETSSRRAYLAQQLAETNLQTEQERSKRLANSLDGALKKLAVRTSDQLEESDSETLLNFNIKSGSSTTLKLDTPREAPPIVKQHTAPSASPNLKSGATACALDGKTFGNRHRDLLIFCQKLMRPYGIPMYEFSKSWSTGHAFCAFIHYYRPDLIEKKYLKCNNHLETLRYVERVAEKLGVRFDGNFVKYMCRRRPGFVKIYYFVSQLYQTLEEHARKAKSSSCSSPETPAQLVK